MSDLSSLRLLVVDTAGIQPYIFNSNRLRENVGASYLVAAATGDWALDAVREAAHDAHNIGAKNSLLDRRIERDAILVEVVYSGGGNFVALFREQSTARAFTQALSKRGQEEAPDLKLLIAYESYQWGDPLGKAIADLLDKIKLQRSIAANAAPLAGLGVTVMCGSTAMPAVGLSRKFRDEEPRPISAEVQAKHEAVDRANAQLRDLLSDDSPFDFPLDFDDLGRTRGDSSFIAVVHADGDGIGKQVQALARQRDPRIYISTMRQFSQNMREAAQAALKGTLDELKRRITWDVERKNYVIAHPNANIRLELSEKDGTTWLPVRPIVFGGDDVTFVCDARLGLALTVDYLRRFEAATKERKLGESGGGASACAGVAMVKTRYPFARAYGLADDLCGEAKTYRRNQGISGSCLHWHFALGGIYGNWDDIHRREYTAQSGKSLTLRPVALSGGGLQTWTTVASAIQHFQTGDWLERHNKAKALRAALRAGAEAESWFYQQYAINDSRRGWQDDTCTHFDALELMDMYIPLEVAHDELET